MNPNSLPSGSGEANDVRGGESDRELLELAAKAVSGKTRLSYGERGAKATDWIVRDDGEILQPTLHGHAKWKPLIDDGDALRLAVNRHMNVDNYSYADAVNVICADNIVVMERFNPHDKEARGAATRRAIVRAAAESLNPYPQGVAAK